MYENLHGPGVKSVAQNALKSFAGVYVIINLINGKTYVGSAITGRMSNRFHKHLFGLNGSKLVAAAVTKYGLSNFAFVVADTLPEVVTREDNQTLLNMEDSFLQRLRPEYNIAPQASNTFGVKHTNETKEMMRMNYSSERRERIGSINRGKRLSPVTIEKIRNAALTRTPMTKESREQVSANSAMAYL